MIAFSFDELLGRFAKLAIRRFGPPGAFLALTEEDAPGAPTLLLPGGEIPEGAEVGHELEVFVSLDSEARPIATLVEPKLARGQVTFLEVTALSDFGAFFDWGLPKELLVPFAEQTRELAVGERHPVGLYLDTRGRLTGTMRVAEMLSSKGDDFTLGEWVDGEAYRNDRDIGLFVIVERAFVALVPRTEPHTLSRGEAAKFRVSHKLPDGKFQLSLRKLASEALDGDAEAILAVLAKPNAPRVSDRTSPEEIRKLFGLSKKAFKRAVGTLLKKRVVDFDGEGCLVRVTR